MSGLREALVEVQGHYVRQHIVTGGRVHCTCGAGVDGGSVESWTAHHRADLTLALVADPEHRDEIRAMWGEQEVGRAFVGPAGQHIGAYQAVRLRDGQPVYAEKETP